MSKIIDLVTELALPIVEGFGCELWDVEYISEGGQWYLRIYIDKDEGVSIDDCENVSRALDPILDEKDPIPTNYIFEVSSAGLTRQLKLPAHFQKFLGETVEVKLYKPLEGTKLYKGVLASYDKGNVTLECGGKTIDFTKEQIAGVHISLL